LVGFFRGRHGFEQQGDLLLFHQRLVVELRVVFSPNCRLLVVELDSHVGVQDKFVHDACHLPGARGRWEGRKRGLRRGQMLAEFCLGHVYRMVFAWALVWIFLRVLVVVVVVVVIGMFIRSIKRHPHMVRSAALLTRVGENMRVRARLAELL
jgi:hypothetical protein